MKIHRFLLPLLLIGSLTGAVRAENPAPATSPERTRQHASRDKAANYQQMREKRMQRLEEKLQLTPEQKARINAIWDQTAEQMQAVGQEAQALKAKRRELMKNTRVQVRTTLTPEQQKIFDELKPQKTGQGGMRGPRPGRGV